MTTRALTPAEISLLSASLAAHGRHRDRLFLLIAVTTGFRVSELLTLKFNQLTAPDGQISREVTITRRLLKGGHGYRAKSIRSRRVPLSGTARAAISDYLATLSLHPTGDTYVFQSRKGENQPITRGQAHHIMKSLAHAAGLDASRVGCHSTRKAYAKGLYAASGNDLIKTQRIMGHTNPLTTARYLDTCEAELDALVTNFDPLACRTPALAHCI